MSFKGVITKLSELGNQAKNINENLQKEIDLNHQRYTGEYCQQANEKVNAEAKTNLEKIQKTAQDLVDKELELQLSIIDEHYFQDISLEQSAELEMISKSNVTIQEMKKYYEKFSNNKAILRCLEKICIDKGYRVVGRSYSGDIEQINGLKNTFQGFVNAIASGDSMRLLISERLANSEVDKYTEYTERAPEIYGSQSNH